ncbi:hypothetical protein JRQ81_007822 [Phrynocephalus forsythii]|uniref:Uncharacterized protein n=1 Tax=Phrynocephalus forsythii TaxID=171643 RepID=A0A9Q1ATE0_9SAUR|nr:hypothetical protein JRQ81_007822 [Phrynocephalus forsythii]
MATPWHYDKSCLGRTSGGRGPESLHFASYFVEAGVKMLSKVRQFFTRKERGVGEEKRGYCPFWRRLPCFRRKIHPAGVRVQSSTEGLSTAVLTLAVGESLHPSSAGSSSLMQGLFKRTRNTSYSTQMRRCSLPPYMSPSVRSAIAFASCEPGSAIDWFLRRRLRRMQVIPMTDKIYFMHDVVVCCQDALDRGKDHLGVLYPKTAILGVVLEVMCELVQLQNTENLLFWVIRAIYYLSQIKPSTPRDMETYLLDLVLQAISKLGEPEDDPVRQASYNIMSADLPHLLQGLWEEEPSSAHLLSILNHLRVWIYSPKGQERVWAMETMAAFLRNSTPLPDFHLPELVLQLKGLLIDIGICVTDTKEEVRTYAREILRHLRPLLPSRREEILIEDLEEEEETVEEEEMEKTEERKQRKRRKAKIELGP